LYRPDLLESLAPTPVFPGGSRATIAAACSSIHFKKRLAEYLKSFKPKILALPGKPLDLIRRQRLGNAGINLVSFPVSERIY
jgi:hypothetical protein